MGDTGAGMSRRAIALSVAVALALVLAIVVTVVGGDDAGEAVSLELEVGFNNNAVTDGVATPEESAELLAATGADIDRVQINWAQIEPRPGEYDFSVYDEIYRADLRHGIEPLFIFAFAPAWAVGPDPACDPTVSSCHLPPAPEYYGAAAETAAVIAERYPRAAAIEIWNEPNTSYFWVPRPDPAAYAELLTLCHEAIKRVEPSMTVAGGSTASGSGSGSMPDAEFVEAVLAAGGGEAMDILSAHAYLEVGDPAGVSAATTVEELREVQLAAGVDAPIWVTETGVSVSGPGAVTEANQAAALVRLTTMLDAVEGVETVLVHTLIRRPTAPDDPQGGYGVLSADQTPTESYCALSDAWGGSACQGP